MLAQFRLALTKDPLRRDPQSTRGCESPSDRVQGSELAVNPVGLADKDQADRDGHHDNDAPPKEAVQEIGQGSGHGAVVLCVEAATILRIETLFLR